MTNLHPSNLNQDKAELVFSEAQKCLEDLHQANTGLMKKLESFFQVFVVVVVAVTGYWFNLFFVEHKSNPQMFWLLAGVIFILLVASVVLLLQINAYSEKPSGSDPVKLLTNDWMRHPIDRVLWSLSELYQGRINQARANNERLAVKVHQVIWFIVILPIVVFVVLVVGYVA